MKKVLALLVLVLFDLSPFFAETLSGQSVVPALSPSLADSDRVNALNDLFKQNLRSNPELALKFGEEGLALAEEIGYEKGLYKISNNLGVLHSNQGSYELALEYHLKNLAHFRRVDDPGRVANCLVNIGGVKFAQGNYDSALEDYQEAFKHYYAVKDTNKAMHVLNNVGTIYQDQGRLGDALNQFLTVLDFRKSQNDTSLTIPALLNVGMVCQLRGQSVEAEGFFKEALELSQATDDKYRSVAAMNSLASTWSDLGRHSESAQLHERASFLAQQINDQFGLAEALIGRARQFSYLDQADSAKVMALEARRICQLIGRKGGESQALIILGESLLKGGAPGEAIESLKTGLAIADTIGHAALLRQGFEVLSDAFAEKGLFKNAYQAQDSFIKYNEEINSQQNNERIAELQAKYEAGRKEEAISLLQLETAESELKIARSRRRNTILIAGLLVLLALALAFLMRFRQKQRLAELVKEQRNHAEEQRAKVEAQNKQIREINSNLEKMIEVRTHAVRAAKEELDVFLYQSAHALRRPLVRIEGIVSLLEAKLADPEDAVLVEKLGLTLKDMDSLLHHLVNVNEVQRREPELEPIGLLELFEEVARTFDWEDAELEIDLPEEMEIACDSFLLRTAISPIFHNALQYRAEKSSSILKVKVSLEASDASISLHIQDNGKGIPAGEVKGVFEMFYRADHHTRGSGLGLYVVLKAAEKLHGTAYATRIPEGGTRITIEFPRHFM